MQLARERSSRAAYQQDRARAKLGRFPIPFRSYAVSTPRSATTSFRG